MSVAYVDTSYLLSDALGERGSSAHRARMTEFAEVFSSRLLEAEFQSALKRERASPSTDLLAAIQWIDVDRSLLAEIDRVLEVGYVKGADCWHLATALYAAKDSSGWTFLTLDARQRTVAKALGFRV